MLSGKAETWSRDTIKILGTYAIFTNESLEKDVVKSNQIKNKGELTWENTTWFIRWRNTVWFCMYNVNKDKYL